MVPLYRDSTVAHWVQPKILVLIINLFSLNFKSIKIEGERVSFSQNERTLEERGAARKRTRTNKGGGRSKPENLERTYFFNVPLFYLILWVCPQTLSGVVWIKIFAFITRPRPRSFFMFHGFQYFQKTLSLLLLIFRTNGLW